MSLVDAKLHLSSEYTRLYTGFLIKSGGITDGFLIKSGGIIDAFLIKSGGKSVRSVIPTRHRSGSTCRRRNSPWSCSWWAATARRHRRRPHQDHSRAGCAGKASPKGANMYGTGSEDMCCELCSPCVAAGDHVYSKKQPVGKQPVVEITVRQEDMMISTGGYFRKQGRLRRHRAAVAATHVLLAYPSGMSPKRATTRVTPTVAIYKGLRARRYSHSSS